MDSAPRDSCQSMNFYGASIMKQKSDVVDNIAVPARVRQKQCSLGSMSGVRNQLGAIRSVLRACLNMCAE
jgi:hypothetical protein